MNKIYNFDKIERESYKIVLNKKVIEVKEPTVKTFGKLQELKFDDNPNYSEELLEVMLPEIFKKNFFRKNIIDHLTVFQKKLLIELVIKVVSGNSRKKNWKLEETLE